MKRILVACILLFIILSISCQERFSPWGIWNDSPLDDRARIRETRYGSFYQNAFQGVWIMENLQDIFPGEEPIPVFMDQGEYDQIISYTEVQDGIIFVIRTRRKKNDPDSGRPLFEYFDTELKMEFLSRNKCKFIYLNHEDINGYKFGSFGTIVRENHIYERIPVEDKPVESRPDE